MMNMPNHSALTSTFDPVSSSTLVLMEGVLPPTSPMMINPLYGSSTPYLGEPSLLHQTIPSNEPLIGDFINSAIVVNFAPENNAYSHYPIDNTDSAKFIWDFSQINMVIPTHVANASSSSHPPPSPPVSGGHGSMLMGRSEEDLAHIKKNDQRANGDSKMRWQQKREKAQNDDKSTDNMIKGQWTLDEDRALKALVNEHGLKNWSQIAQSLDGRIGKQCRERWYNHLQPNIRKGPWTLKEDIIFIKAHKKFGNKWAKIAKRMLGRTENDIKNRWNATKRCQNTRTRKTKSNTCNGSSILRAYIKEVTATDKKDKATEKQENNESIKGKIPMFSGLCSTDIGLMLRMELSNQNFVKEAWAAELFNAPMQDNGNGTIAGSVVNSGNAKILLNGENNKKEAGNAASGGGEYKNLRAHAWLCL